MILEHGPQATKLLLRASRFEIFQSLATILELTDPRMCPDFLLRFRHESSSDERANPVRHDPGLINQPSRSVEVKNGALWNEWMKACGRNHRRGERVRRVPAAAERPQASNDRRSARGPWNPINRRYGEVLAAIVALHKTATVRFALQTPGVGRTTMRTDRTVRRTESFKMLTD